MMSIIGAFSRPGCSHFPINLLQQSLSLKGPFIKPFDSIRRNYSTSNGNAQTIEAKSSDSSSWKSQISSSGEHARKKKNKKLVKKETPNISKSSNANALRNINRPTGKVLRDFSTQKVGGVEAARRDEYKTERRKDVQRNKNTKHSKKLVYAKKAKVTVKSRQLNVKNASAKRQKERAKEAQGITKRLKDKGKESVKEQKDREVARKEKEREAAKRQKEKEKAKKEKLKEKDKEREAANREKEERAEKKKADKEEKMAEKKKAHKEKQREKAVEKKQKEKEKREKEKEKEREKKEQERKKADAEKARAKELEEQKEKDKIPKRPLSSFLRFVEATRAQLKEQNPTMTIVDLTRELGKRWRELPTEGRQTYSEMYNREIADYINARAAYLASKPKHPKRNKTSFLWFMEEQFKLRDPKTLVKDTLSRASVQWKALSADDKKKYEALAEQDKTRYAQEKAEYEKQTGAAQVD